MSPLPQGIYVACTHAAAWVRVIGRGACRNSACLREFGLQKLREGCRTLYVDLRECESMDSTFLGVFAGIGLALGDSGRLILLGVRENNRRAFAELGLDRLAGVETPPSEDVHQQWPQESDFQFLPGSDLSAAEAPFDAVDRALLMLDCHEDLCRIDKRNEAKFHDVKQFLREDISRHQSDLPDDHSPG